MPNSSEETAPETPRQRHTTITTIRANQPEIEENSRKELISALGDKAASDRLTLYMRKPSEPRTSHIRAGNNYKNSFVFKS